jgi:hypothetical protein
MIPQNTVIITKEMTKQLDAEQTMILRELERYDSWFNSIQFQLIGAIGKLKLLAKKWFKFIHAISITNLFKVYKAT